MVTIEQFNTELKRVNRSIAVIAVIAMRSDGQFTIFPLRRGRGIDAFQMTVQEGQYAHVALKFGGRVMAIWHAQHDTGSAAQDAPAQPGNAAIASISDFDPGDEVVIKADVDCDIPFDGEKLRLLRDNRVVGKVVSIRELAFGDPIKVQFPNDYYCFMPDELEHVSEPEPAPELAFNEDPPLPNTADYWRGQYETACNVIYRMVSESGCDDANAVVDTIQQQRRELAAANERFAALVHEIDMLSVSSSSQVQTARKHLLDAAKTIDPDTVVLLERLTAMRGELADTVIERDAAIEDRRRFVAALEEISAALMVARPVNDIFNDIRAIVDRALGEPEGER
jgi:hypothetical protein